MIKFLVSFIESFFPFNSQNFYFDKKFKKTKKSFLQIDKNGEGNLYSVNIYFQV
jgi:hypothetical protein